MDIAVAKISDVQCDVLVTGNVCPQVFKLRSNNAKIEQRNGQDTCLNSTTHQLSNTILKRYTR